MKVTKATISNMETLELVSIVYRLARMRSKK